MVPNHQPVNNSNIKAQRHLGVVLEAVFQHDVLLLAAMFAEGESEGSDGTVRWVMENPEESLWGDLKIYRLYKNDQTIYINIRSFILILILIYLV